MKTHSLSRILSLCLLLIISLSCTGVYASWNYATFFTNELTPDLTLGLEDFTWKSENVLPGTPEDTKLGNNYMTLLEQIKNNSKMGLNGSKNTLFENTKKKGILHSDANVQGGNLKHLFITSECRELDFLLHYISDTEIHAYLYANTTLDEATVDKTIIQVYRATIKLENGTWKDTGTMVGYAVTRKLSGVSYLTINPSEWTPGIMPDAEN